MFFNFMDELRAAGITASLKEHLVLLEALDKDVIQRSPEEFYYLSRATFVKDEGLLDRFDQVFSKVFKGIETSCGLQEEEIPLDWLKVDRYRRHLALRQFRLQSRGSPDWWRRRPEKGDQGLGQARVPESRQYQDAGNAEYQGRAAAAAQVRARGCSRRTRHRPDDKRHGEERLARHSHAGRTS